MTHDHAAFAAGVVPLRRGLTQTVKQLGGSGVPHVAASAVAHLALLVLAANTPPTMEEIYSEAPSAAQRAWMQKRLRTVAGRPGARCQR